MIEQSTEIESESGWEPVRERIAARAYELSQSEEAGSDIDNWLRAEQELELEPGDEE